MYAHGDQGTGDVYSIQILCSILYTYIIEHLWRGVIGMRRRTCVVTCMPPTTLLTPFTFAFHTLRNTRFLLFIHNNLLKLLVLILIWVVEAISSSAPLWS